MAQPWTVDDIPHDLSEKTILITGATGGIGLETARVLAARKCNLILACRNDQRMAAVASQLKEAGAGRVDELVCDLGDFESVRACAAKALDMALRIDVLLLNAGMITLDNKVTRSEGVELVMAVNHLGHFLLTGLLFPCLSPGARIISVSSLSHAWLTHDIPWDEIANGVVANHSGQMYLCSKRANLLFVEELNRLLVRRGSQIIAVAAHPGFTYTPIWEKADGNWRKVLYTWMQRKLGQPAADGAWPLLMAAVDPDITRDSYYAPSKSLGVAEMYGPPIRNGKKIEAVKNEKDARRCWEESEKLTNLKFVL